MTQVIACAIVAIKTIVAERKCCRVNLTLIYVRVETFQLNVNTLVVCSWRYYARSIYNAIQLDSMYNVHCTSTYMYEQTYMICIHDSGIFSSFILFSPPPPVLCFILSSVTFQIDFFVVNAKFEFESQRRFIVLVSALHPKHSL